MLGISSQIRPRVDWMYQVYNHSCDVVYKIRYLTWVVFTWKLLESSDSHAPAGDAKYVL